MERILIIGDPDSDPELIEKVLMADFDEIYTVMSKKDAVALFDEHQPTIVIFTYLELEQVEADYIYLLRNIKHTEGQSFSTLLLCKGKDAPKACSLCRQGVFDDYLVDKPLQDADRLLWAVHSAHQKRTSGGAGGEAPDYSALEALLSETSGELDEVIDKGDRVRTDSTALFKQLNRELSLKFAEMIDQLNQQSSASGGANLNINELVQKFSSTHLTPMIKQTHHSLDQRLSDVQQGMRSHQSRLKEADNWVEQQKMHDIKILIVDDEEDYRETIGDFLDEYGYQTRMAGSAFEALAMISNWRPDTILMDYEMPGLNGVDAVKVLKRTLKESESIPVIMLTGHGTKAVVEDAMGAGISDFMVKTARLDLLDEKIKSHLS